MADPLNRREFLKASALASGAGLLSFEEIALAGHRTEHTDASEKADLLPTGKIGDLEITRMIAGGNLISGFAHSRDLIYVSDLLRRYFTDDKIVETLRTCEQNGINTAILRLDQNTLRILNRYWKQEGGKLQWICQAKITEKDVASGLMPAIDNGAHAVYVHGGVADELVAKGRVDVLGEAVEFIRKNGAKAGIAGHMIEVPIAVTEAGIDVDFFMKTLNAKSYWSAGPMPRMDSVWEETPEKTIAFMKSVRKPWIAYKVLGAGAIEPQEGFNYAFENGADFICVGMFDWQVAEDVAIVRRILAGDLNRTRPWVA